MAFHFTDQLAAAVRAKHSPVCVGLDPRWEQLPEPIRQGVDANSLSARAEVYRRFCCDVVDAVAPLAPAIKPQAAFFEELGPPGMDALAQVIDHAHKRQLLVILDAKRNDIGATAVAYAQAYLGANSAWRADALTISPYLGEDSLEPFVDAARLSGAGLFVLVKTSNPGGGMLQDLATREGSVYQVVGRLVERLASASVGRANYGLVGAVAGATYPDQLAELRQAMPHAWLLIPGYGSQGGVASDVAAGFDPQGLGALVNNSRGVLFAHARPPYSELFGAAQWQRAVEAATRAMLDELRAVLIQQGDVPAPSPP